MIIQCPFCLNEYKFGMNGVSVCPSCKNHYQPTHNDFPENTTVLYTGEFLPIEKNNIFTLKKFFYTKTKTGVRK